MVSQAKGGCKECGSKTHTAMYHKPKKPLKRTAIKKTSPKRKPTMRDVNKKLKDGGKLTKRELKIQYDKQKEKAWKAFSYFIRIRDSLATTGTIEWCVCITCNVRGDSEPKPFGHIQAGHGVGGRRNAVLFHEEIVNGQCDHCNSNGARGGLAGDYGNYAIALIKRYGLEHTEALQRLKTAHKDYSYQDLVDIEEEYKNKVKELLNGR